MKSSTLLSHLATLFSLSLLILPNISSAQSNTENPSTFSLGAGVVGQAKYLGSDKLKAMPLLYIDYNLGNGFFANTIKGIGYQYNHQIDNNISLFAKTAFNYELGRKDKGELKGMGKIKGSFINTLQFGINFNQYVAVSIGSDIQLTERDNGSRYSLSTKATVYQTEQNHLSIITNAYYFSQKRNQTYFGVTEKQSANTGFKKYTLGSGLGQIDAGINWVHHYNKDWSMSTFAGASYLVNDTANSPIVKRKISPVFLLGIIYNF